MERLRAKDPETLKRLSDLEALFAPKKIEDLVVPPPPRSSAKMVTPKAAGSPNPKRERLLERLLEAEGTSAVSRATDDLVGAGFVIPAEQEVLLKLLEHSDEERVRSALVQLATILASKEPHRRTVLCGRLRRLEESAEETATRDLAATLRRRLTVPCGSMLSLGRS